VLREVKIYPIVRECHLHVDDDEVREACDRVVQVIMRKEEGEEEEIPQGAMGAAGADAGTMVALQNEDEDDEDDQIVEIC
jgi:hypothetical protein